MYKSFRQKNPFIVVKHNRKTSNAKCIKNSYINITYK